MSEEQVEPGVEEVVDGEGVGRPRSRRDLLKAIGLAAGAVAAGRALAPDPAGAADGQSLTLGQANSSTNTTALSTSGAISGDGAVSIAAAKADFGLYASAKMYGLVGQGPGGVLGLGAVGGVFSGSVVAVNLDPQLTAGTPAGQAYQGDLLVDNTGVLYLCVASGTPGTWIKVSHVGFQPLSTPQRVYDSRNSGGKLSGGAVVGTVGTPRLIQIAGAVPGMPPNAVAVVGNLTTTGQTANGFATIWPDGAWPGTSSINFSAGVDIANAFSIGLSAGTLRVAASAPTHVIIDITGYHL